MFSSSDCTRTRTKIMFSGVQTLYRGCVTINIFYLHGSSLKEFIPIFSLQMKQQRPRRLSNLTNITWLINARTRNTNRVIHFYITGGNKGSPSSMTVKAFCLSFLETWWIWLPLLLEPFSWALSPCGVCPMPRRVNFHLICHSGQECTGGVHRPLPRPPKWTGGLCGRWEVWPHTK